MIYTERKKRTKTHASISKVYSLPLELKDTSNCFIFSIEIILLMASSSNCCQGPGYCSPLSAMREGPREEYLFLSMISCDRTKPDYLATMNVNPQSEQYQQIVQRVYAQDLGEEFHHTGWNACSSCHDDPTKKRRFFIVGTLISSRLYVIDTQDITNQKIHKIVEAEEFKKWDLSVPHTIHCLGKSDMTISSFNP